ncbi:unconventional myosin-Va-like [Tubulanus polymorphus]|uniref:unconventional myosin-Va-like n=1 Tax=Tubulanus polymorphus TaxID=672921 RepID=UPI003DA653DA
MSTTELYTQGARVWVPDPELVWRGGILSENFNSGDKSLKVHYEDNPTEETSIVVKDMKQDLPPLRNPEILIGENDLTSLSYLHEPAVLYNLHVRFCERNAIYTYCGIVLVAINPYEQLPIYGPEIIQAYSGQDMGSMDPHIFAVAEEAFKFMSRFDQNQSIIVSGESGAGKTVSAKYAMRYFATVGGNEAETQIEKKVLASNPIMEAIGNAKTTRNDNSSRFGKYIEISFSPSCTIVGANMRTYLLEKSRVVFQAPEERNYHIFYQLCASSELPEFESFRLSHQDDFLYTCQGDNPSIPGVDDAEELENTREAFALLGISPQKQFIIFQILAAILHFGNVQIKEDDRERVFIPKNDSSLLTMCELLGVEETSMRMWISNRKIATQTETLTKPLNLAETINSRDALAKHIYARVFNWIVAQINKSLRSSVKSEKFIGVLDIYGFETFEINSFEQFCINYANEKLQQQFNRHVFILEQEEYDKEQIEWSFIDFYDNQPCIDLIEDRLGILDLLDEECKMPRGSDQNWCVKLYDKHMKAQHFEKPRLSREAFIVHHFADKVTYQINGFLEKNRDTVLSEQIDILKASQFQFVAELFAEASDAAPLERKYSRSSSFSLQPGKPSPKKTNKSHKQTVGSQFRDSLKQLMGTLGKTTPHYIRCIKPNDVKEAFTFEPKRAVQQLRACGVLETIRISAAGYPSRWTYAEFIQRYRVLAVSRDIVKNDMKKSCANIIEKLISDPDKFQFGKTKIFFRAGQVAYFEKLRADKLRTCGVMIQKHVRGWLQRRRYRKILKTVYLVQRYGRGLLARRKAKRLRETAAAIKIQSCYRGYRQWKRYERIRAAVLTIQSYARGMAGRHRYMQARYDAKATVIQTRVRGWLGRRRYRKFLYGLVKLQSHVRRRKAKKELKQLKIEARSVDHIKKVNLGLENKIIQLQQRLDERNKHMKAAEEEQQEILKREITNVRKEESIASNKVSELLERIKALEAELESEREEKRDLVSEKEEMATNHARVQASLNEDKINLKQQLDEANRRLQLNEDLIKQSGKELGASNLLLQELESERAHHQNLVKDHSRLQQRFENVQEELRVMLTKNVSVSRSASNVSNISDISVTPSLLDTDEKSDAEKDSSTEKEKDVSQADQGYGSVRDKPETRGNVQQINWQTSPPGETSTDVLTPPTPPEVQVEPPVPAKRRKDSENITLICQLQKRIKDLERDKQRVMTELEHMTNIKSRSPVDVDDAYEQIRLQELEMENAKLKDELMKLRKMIAEYGKLGDESGRSEKEDSAAKEFMDQFEAMADELERRREECIQLRSVIAERSRSMSQVAQENYGNDPDLINEDNELVTAYKTQKMINRALDNQLVEEQKLREKVEADLRKEIIELKKDNERQQKLIGQNAKFLRKKNVNMTPEAKIEASMQHEITRMTCENLDLREKIDQLEEQIAKLKKGIKIYAKRLKKQEEILYGNNKKKMAAANSKSSGHLAFNEIVLIADSSEDAMPKVHHQQREYKGMLEYRPEDEAPLIKALIYDLKPKAAMTLLPGMPAYILFMCIRHTDYINDDEKVRTLLTATINGIKKVIKKRHDELDTMTMWLANTCRLLHNLKQYSGEKAFQADNSTRQNEHCLQNFDLSEYRQVLSDLAVWIYQGLTKLMQQTIQPMIVPSVLEHEAIAGLSGSKPTGMRGRSSSTAQHPDHDQDSKKYSLDSLLKSMSHFLRMLQTHCVDPELVKQVFKQLFYFICAGALNNLLLRKEMCHWSKGMQIRYNISHLEQWMRDSKVTECGGQEMLEPIVQASQLLQARKTDTDVATIVEMCSKLTQAQIVKILNLYTPVNEFEERVPISFIRKIQEKLRERNDETNELLMDTKQSFPVTFPFNPSGLGLETVQVPDVLGLPFLKRV